MERLETLGDERIHVSPHGSDAVCVAVTDPRFGRISTVRVSREQALELAHAVALARLEALPADHQAP